jgi:excisionase family DNA binding protein
MPELLSVEQASRRLAVSPRRVRAMIADEILPAERVGRVYLIDASAVERLARRPRPRGRRLRAPNAWALLALLSDLPDNAAARPSSSQHRLAGFRARGHEAVLIELMRSEPRAVIHRWRVLPRDLDLLLGDGRLVRSGLSAGARGIDVPFVPSRDGVDAYVSNADLDELKRRLRPIENAEASNVQLRVPIGGDWILSEPVAPPAVVAADLLDDPDPRVARAARDVLWELCR